MSTAPFVQTFNYSQFESQDLAQKASETLNEFKSFIRQTFDGIIEIGRKLQEIQDSCLVSCKNGKKVFKQWLDSKQFFGASNGTLHKGMSAISAFVSDLTCGFQQETAF